MPFENANSKLSSSSNVIACRDRMTQTCGSMLKKSTSDWYALMTASSTFTYMIGLSNKKKEG